MTLLNRPQNVEETILDRNDYRLSEILLFLRLMMQKTIILNATIQYILDPKKIDDLLTNL